MSKVMALNSPDPLMRLLENNWDSDDEEDIEMFNDIELMMPFQVLNIGTWNLPTSHSFLQLRSFLNLNRKLFQIILGMHF